MAHLIWPMMRYAIAASRKQPNLASCTCLAILFIVVNVARAETRSSFKTVSEGGQSPFAPKTAQKGTVPDGFETASSKSPAVAHTAGAMELQQPAIVLPMPASAVPPEADDSGSVVDLTPRPLPHIPGKARRKLPLAPNEFLRTQESHKALGHSEPSTTHPRISSAMLSDHSLRQLNFQTNQGQPALTAPQAPTTPDAAAKKTDPCAALATRPFSEFGIDIAMPTGNAPEDHASGCWESINSSGGPLAGGRCWATTTFNWNATCFCHRPMYFEEINLERYGYGCCESLQPAASAAHFFATIPVLPYCIATDCPGECIYTLGHYRPGSCPPWQCHWPRYTTRGALAEGGVWTGMVFLIP